jgi:hypothetical protein
VASHHRVSPIALFSSMAIACPRVLERSLSPSLERSEYQLNESSDIDASPWGSQSRSCSIQGWGPCPNPVVPLLNQASSSSGLEEEEEDPMEITVVPTTPPWE